MLQIKVAMTDRYFGECRSHSVGPAHLYVNFFFPHYSICLYLCLNMKVTWNARFQPASNCKKTGSNQSNKHIVQAPFLFWLFLHKAGGMLHCPGYSDTVLSAPPYGFTLWWFPWVLGAAPFYFIGQLQRTTTRRWARLTLCCRAKSRGQQSKPPSFCSLPPIEMSGGAELPRAV